MENEEHNTDSEETVEEFEQELEADSSDSSPVEQLDNTEEASSKASLGPDEVYCVSCGDAIKKEAEVCPKCGVRQQDSDSGKGASDYSIPDSKQYELEKVANKDITTVMLVSFLLTPAGYWMIGKTGLAIINLLTFNYLLTGFIVVPFHTRKIIKDARSELRRAGVGGY